MEADWNMLIKQVPRIPFVFLLLATLGCFALPAAADQDDPPTRVARLSYAQGSVSFQPAGTDDWVTPGINRPMTIGDKMWADNNGRVELQLDDSVVRMSGNTGFSFLNLDDNVTQIQLTSGTLLLRVHRLDPNETYEIDTPNLAFSVLRPGSYRISVDENGDQTGISVRSGEAEVTGGGGAYAVHANDSYVFSGTDQLYATRQDTAGNDQFESWAAERDRRWENSPSTRYVPKGVIGYEDLDQYGSWRQVPEYGDCWFPRVANADWAPYHYGHWDYIEPWGYTWVDDEPWGFAPFHYGRWVHLEGSWGWVPAPRTASSIAYARPVYAPALVAWVGSGGGVGGSVAWFPLAPREVYVPSYRVSRNYVERVNVTNTTVNTTVVNNYYNTTVINNNPNVTNVRYVNREVPGAIAATTSQAFTAAQPIARNRVQVDTHAATSAPVRAVAPPVMPVKQSVLGPNRQAAAKPPAAVESRTVIAKATPPPPRPSFEKSQAAIQSNGGKPLSPEQQRQIQHTAAQPQPTVKMAPAAKTSAAPPPTPPNRTTQPSAAPPARTAPNAQPNNPPPANRPANQPPTATPPTRPNEPRPTQQPERTTPPASANPPQPNRPAERPSPNPQPANPPQSNRPDERPTERPANPPAKPTMPPPTEHPGKTVPVHPNEQPPAPRPTPTPSTNPALDQKHQQQQEQLRVRQEQERQRVQHQQEQEDQHAAQQADQAKRQQLEQRHQQQTEQLQKKQQQEQQQQQKTQQQERQAQQKPKKPEQNPPPQEPKP
jgi:hypothetical protein